MQRKKKVEMSAKTSLWPPGSKPARLVPAGTFTCHPLTGRARRGLPPSPSRCLSPRAPPYSAGRSLAGRGARGRDGAGQLPLGRPPAPGAGGRRAGPARKGAAGYATALGAARCSLRRVDHRLVLAALLLARAHQASSSAAKGEKGRRIGALVVPRPRTARAARPGAGSSPSLRRGSGEGTRARPWIYWRGPDIGVNAEAPTVSQPGLRQSPLMPGGRLPPCRPTGPLSKNTLPARLFSRRRDPLSGWDFTTFPTRTAALGVRLRRTTSAPGVRFSRSTAVRYDSDWAASLSYTGSRWRPTSLRAPRAKALLRLRSARTRGGGSDPGRPPVLGPACNPTKR